MTLGRRFDGFWLAATALLLVLVVAVAPVCGRPTTMTAPVPAPAPYLPQVLVPSVGLTLAPVGWAALIGGQASSGSLFRDDAALVGGTGRRHQLTRVIQQAQKERPAAGPTGAGEVNRDLTLRPRCTWIRSLWRCLTTSSVCCGAEP